MKGMKKIKISCFLNNEEKAEVEQYIKELLKNPDAEFYESGGLGVYIERTATWAMFYVYRVVGTAEVKIGKKKRARVS